MVDTKNLKALLGRQQSLKDWLSHQTTAQLSEQKHLDAGSPEQVYWHFGYLTALSDMIELFTAEERTSRNAGKTN